MKRPWAFICAAEGTSSAHLRRYCRTVFECKYIVPARERFCKHSVWISKRTFWGGAPNPVAYRWR